MKTLPLIILWSILLTCLGFTLYFGLIAIFEFYKPERDLEIVFSHSLFSVAILLVGAFLCDIAESYLALRGIR